MHRPFAKEKETALRAVIAAAKLCVKVRATLVDRSTLLKQDRSPVTVADYGSQAVVCRVLQEVFPHDRVVAEEDSQALRKTENREVLEFVVRQVRHMFPHARPERVCSWIDWGRQEPARRFWTLDPIDGTKGFLRGDQYAVALALIEDGQVQLGVLGCPNLRSKVSLSSKPRGAFFVALKGQGAVETDFQGREEVPLTVSAVSSPTDACLVESFEPAHSDLASHTRIARRLNLSAPPLRMNSQAKYGALARGEASIYLRLPSPETPQYREKIWDHAAGSIIVEEAGGKVTDAFGRILDFSRGKQLERNRGIIATNGLLHEAVLQAVQVTLGKDRSP